MPVKEITVTRWGTSDGKVFEDLEDAQSHEDSIPLRKFQEWYEDYSLQSIDSDGYGHAVPEDEMFDWLEDNMRVLKEMEIFKDDK